MDFLYENRTTAISIFYTNYLSKIPHLHKEIEIIYVNKGKTIAYADKNSYLLNEDELFIAFPNQIHYYSSHDNSEFVVLIFSAEIIYLLGNTILKSKPLSNIISQNKEIKEIFLKISKINGKYSELSLNGYLNVLMGIILSLLTLKTIDDKNSSPFYDIVKYCTRNFKENITLDDLSKELNISKYYISHLINLKLKQNLNTYLNSLRIDEACHLLKDDNKKIADISEDVGFGTIRSFNRAFKQIMGISPKKYRENMEKLKNSF